MPQVCCRPDDYGDDCDCKSPNNSARTWLSHGLGKGTVANPRFATGATLTYEKSRGG